LSAVQARVLDRIFLAAVGAGERACMAVRSTVDSTCDGSGNGKALR